MRDGSITPKNLKDYEWRDGHIHPGRVAQNVYSIWGNGNLIPSLSVQRGELTTKDIRATAALTRRKSKTMSETNGRLKEAHRALLAEHEALQTAHRRLQRAERLRQDLVSMLVHDLKAPLAVLLASLDLLDTELTERSSAELREVFGVASRSGEEMLQLVNNLLEIQCLEAGQMPVCAQPLDVILLIQAVVRQVRLLARQRRVSLHLHLPKGLSPAWADARLTERIMTNLLDNAVRFAPSGGEVVVSGQIQKDHLTLSVTDNGPGIPAAQQERIFERFYQGGRSPRQGPACVGLGLAFCKLAVEAQQGRIWVESAPGTGARFSFTLPAWQGA